MTSSSDDFYVLFNMNDDFNKKDFFVENIPVKVKYIGHREFKNNDLTYQMYEFEDVHKIIKYSDGSDLTGNLMIGLSDPPGTEYAQTARVLTMDKSNKNIIGLGRTCLWNVLPPISE